MRPRRRLLTRSSSNRAMRCQTNGAFIQYTDMNAELTEEIYGVEAGKIVRGAWEEVGVNMRADRSQVWLGVEQGDEKGSNIGFRVL